MATYIYETIPKNPKAKPRRFEVQQKMTEPPLRSDPKTGQPVRRVITGGSGGTVLQPSVSATPAPADVPRQAQEPRSANGATRISARV